MSYTVITTKIDPQTKREAMKTADELGIPLSVVIKAFLKQFIKTKTVEFSARENEIPSEYLIQTIKQARIDRKAGKASPIFESGEATVRWLEEQGI